MAALAALAGVSPRHLARLYKVKTGLTISQRFRDLQMQRAADMLAAGSSLTDTALACGFCSQSHFTGAYRKYFSQTPGRARAAGGR